MDDDCYQTHLCETYVVMSSIHLNRLLLSTTDAELTQFYPPLPML